MRKRARLALLGAIGVAGALVASSCGGGHHGSSSSAATLTGPGVLGIVADYDEAPARGVPVALDPPSGPRTTVAADGRFSLPAASGTHVLRVGDSMTTATVSIPVVVGAQSPTFLDRPVFLPSLESGASFAVPPSVLGSIAVASSNLAGVSLSIPSGTLVGYPPSNTTQTVTITGVSPTRLPAALPAPLTTRAAYAIEPAGTRFSPGAQLTIPRLEDLSVGPWDLYELDASGTWSLAAPLAVVNTYSLTATIGQGAIYAAVPHQVVPAAVSVTGRVVANGRAVPNYRATCWNQASAPTGADGRFTIPGVPTSYPAFPVRVFPASPGVDAAPEVVTALFPAGTQDVGDVNVQDLPPETVGPTVVSTQPPDGATAVPTQTPAIVQLSEPIDPATLGISLRGTNGKAPGQAFMLNAFTVAFIPSANLDPLDTYFITLDPGIQDLAGNSISTKQLAFKFTTDASNPPAPTDQKIYALAPLTATATTLVTLTGRNFPGGDFVTVGASQGSVQLETATTLAFFPPPGEPANQSTVTVTNRAFAGLASIAPLVLDLRSAITALSAGVVARQAPPSDLFARGTNVSAGTLYVDGAAIAAVDSVEPVNGQSVVVSKDVNLGTGSVLGTLLTGPASVRGPGGKPGASYRFLQVRDGAP